MRNVGGGNDDVAGKGARRGVTDGELGLALPDDPGLGIGVHMQGRPLARLIVDQEERHLAAKVAALEANRTALAGLWFLMSEGS